MTTSINNSFACLRTLLQSVLYFLTNYKMSEFNQYSIRYLRRLSSQPFAIRAQLSDTDMSTDRDTDAPGLQQVAQPRFEEPGFEDQPRVEEPGQPGLEDQSPPGLEDPDVENIMSPWGRALTWFGQQLQFSHFDLKSMLCNIRTLLQRIPLDIRT